MNTTKALFSELVYDFQSEQWNEFALPKLSLRDRCAICAEKPVFGAQAINALWRQAS